MSDGEKQPEYEKTGMNERTSEKDSVCVCMRKRGMESRGNIEREGQSEKETQAQPGRDC